MDELIIRSLQDETTWEEEDQLRVWRLTHTDNEHRYQALRKLWALAQIAAPEGDEDIPDIDVLIDRAEADPQTAELTPAHPIGSAEPPTLPGRRARSAWLRRSVIGALAASLAGAGFGIGTLSDRNVKPAGMLSEGEIVTGSGEMTTVTLADGSSIRLGPQSRLRLSESETRRVARLEGRAFFGVQADSARPFTVVTEQSEANVLGTRFEVRTDEEEFRVLVVEGTVSVSADGEEASVSDGQMSRAARGRGLSTDTVADVYRHLDWIGDAMVFQATPLRRAVNEIEERYGVDITIQDPALADLRVTATFTGRSIDQVVFVLCQIVNTTCAVDEGRIRIGTLGPRSPVQVDRQ